MGKGGGLGLFINTKTVSVLDPNVLESGNDDFERFWVNLEINKEKLTIGITYFPEDNEKQYFTKATDLQNELINNIGHLQGNGHKVLLLGDFNAKLKNDVRSSNGILLKNITSVTGMVNINLSSKCTGEITWSRGLQSSAIDYVLCCPKMYKLINYMIIDEEKEYSIGSDHNFIVLKTTLSSALANKEKPNTAIQKWNISDKTDWDLYHSQLSKAFEAWCHNNITSVDDLWSDIKSRIISAAEASIGYKSYKNKREFWDKEINTLIKDRKKANKLYNTWAKNPSSSPELLNLLWDDYLCKKRKVSDTIKVNMVKHKVNIIIKNSAKSSSNAKQFWKTLKRSNTKNNYPLQIRDPDNNEVIITDPLIIKKKLGVYWSKLGDGNDTRRIDHHNTLKELENKSGDETALKTFTFEKEQIKNAITKLKNNKAVGTDSIPGEFLKYGQQCIVNALQILFNKIKLLEAIPSEWYEGLIKPIFKEGNNEVLNNYRGITITSTVYKTLATVLENQSMKYMESANAFGENQGAFRHGRRCEDQLFALKGICAIRKSKKLKTYLAFIDISKAFDTINRDRLFIHLWTKGIQDKAWRMIRMLYKRVDNKVIFGNIESDVIDIPNGVKQGCVLSPLLFNLVASDLNDMLFNIEGISINEMNVNALLYADDIVLIAKNDKDLELLLQIAANFADKWSLSFNEKKSQVLVMGKRLSPKMWQLGNKYIQETNSYKYLGVYINRQLKDHTHILEYLKKKSTKMEGYVRHLLASHLDINRIEFGNALWFQAILPSISHCASVWLNNSDNYAKCLKSIQYNFAKAVLKINSKAMPNYIALMGELGWTPIIDHLDLVRIKYLHHLQNMDNGRLTKIIFNEMIKISPENTRCPFNFIKSTKEILTRNGLDFMLENLDNLDISSLKRVHGTNNILNVQHIRSTSSSLRYYFLHKPSYECAPYLLKSLTNYSATLLKLKLRCGILPIGENLKRQNRSDGCCKCGAFESAKHFILYCPFYEDARMHMWRNIFKYNNELNIFNDFYITECLLSDRSDVFNVCFIKFIQEAWEIRNNILGSAL